ncbi:hypothetical protein A3F37_03760 [Candidatus Saccharibacteria bacterium RIFCSPHIGHO2_12_FULL_41_12]|nr:MAG: hypothetical protein A3F37_03760 [Candidatus Saccharibacteria bacterium RIFCSPHIGHO2_12_FULL_41_12]
MNDDVDQATFVRDLIINSGSKTLLVDRITIAEVTYVLRSMKYNHQQIYELFEELCYYPSLLPLGEIEGMALDIYRDTNLDFEDATLVANAKINNYKLGTFDKKMINLLKSL